MKYPVNLGLFADTKHSPSIFELTASMNGKGAGRLRVPFVMEGLAAALMVGVIYVGIWPQQLFDAADNAAELLRLSV